MDQRPRPATAELLDLSPHPEGGWFRETGRAARESVPDGYPGRRAAATSIYFLLTPGEESAWHRVRSDEVWLWHSGGPLTLLDGGDGDTPPAAAAGAPPPSSPWDRTWPAASGRSTSSRPATGNRPARRRRPRSWSAAWWPPASTSPTSPSSTAERACRARQSLSRRRGCGTRPQQEEPVGTALPGRALLARAHPQDASIPVA